MNEPKTIYLQVGEDYDSAVDNFKELDVTWCSDSVDETDIEYCKITAAELAATREALKIIKAVVVGDRHPRWSNIVNTTESRMEIADICDRALAALEQVSR